MTKHKTILLIIASIVLVAISFWVDERFGTAEFLKRNHLLIPFIILGVFLPEKIIAFTRKES